MGGGGTRVSYKAPKPDDTFAKFLADQAKRDADAQKRADDAKEAERLAEEKRNAAGAFGYTGFKTGIQQQLSQGLLGFDEASSQIRDYAIKYNMTPPEQDIAQLGNFYRTSVLPGRQDTAISGAYEEILGREATPEERRKAQERYKGGYYTSNQDLRDALYKSQEYQKKFNDNYLDSYYDTKFGSSVEDRTIEVKDPKTGETTTKVSKLRRFNFDPALLPTYSGDLEAATGVSQPDYEKYFSEARSVEELEQGLQGVRESRQFLYSAGLTNLQGDIDKEVQKLKTQGSKELAKTQSEGALYNTLVGSFSF